MSNDTVAWVLRADRDFDPATIGWPDADAPTHADVLGAALACLVIPFRTFFAGTERAQTEGMRGGATG